MTSPTVRLHHANSFLLDFDAVVVAQHTWQGAPSVILDQTAFYAEAGGQTSDLGVLGGLPVVNVQVDDGGVVHHVVTGALPAPGTHVHGVVDKQRRRLNMALHTGQHMLSRALLDVCAAETVSSRLGEGGGCTIDLDVTSLMDGDVAKAEDLVNAVVDDAVEVRAFFPTAAELAALPLRRAPKVTQNIRVVDVAGFDVSPCGGTHCTNSAQVGLVKVTGLERYKGMMRVGFEAGRRARQTLWAHSAALMGLGAAFTCGPMEVTASVDKLRRDLQETRELLGAARARLATHTADGLLAAARASGETVVVAHVGDGDAEMLRALAKRLTAEPALAVVLAAASAEGTPVLVSRGASSTLDCGATLKRLAQEAGGRGGGKPAHAEGRLPVNVDLVALTAWLPRGTSAQG